MRVENLVFDAADPVRLGRFWALALGAEPLSEADGGYEARLRVAGGPWLDLCFQQVPEPATRGPRLHLDLHGGDLHGGAARDAVIDRLLGLGARHLDIGQHDVAWVVLADLEGNAFCVREEQSAYQHSGPLAAVPMDIADPVRDGAFWAELTGWVPVAGVAPATLRHPSGRGLLLELWPEPEPKRVKNRLHLDLRPIPGEEPAEQVDRACDLGASRLSHEWGDDLPWTVLADPSGNEFCILSAEAS